MRHIHIFIILLIMNTLHAQDSLLLWPDGAPGAKGTTANDMPRMYVYLAPDITTEAPAMLICPGGAYAGLAMNHEGHQAAAWCNKLGMHAFVLAYRVNNNDFTGYGYPAQLQDAERAMRIIRSNAAQWKIHKDKIGVMGFSAGGHLASTLATHYSIGNPEATDQIERLSARPDFVVLVYPVISMKDGITHKHSRKMLAANDKPTEEFILHLSNELCVNSLTPPTILIHASDDKGVLPENSILFYKALLEHNIAAELHIYKNGGHGFGFRITDPVLSTWPDRVRDWMVASEILQTVDN